MTDATESATPSPAPAKRRRLFPIILLIVVIGVAIYIQFFVIPQFKPPRGWLEDFDQAMALAKSQNSKVVVLVTHRKPGQTAQHVIRYVIQKPGNRTAFQEGKFVGVMVRLRGDDKERMKEDYKVTVTPTLLLLSPDGKEITRREGEETKQEVPFRDSFLKGR